jgi:mannosyltransferase OCH1-like enzyme
MLIPKYIHQIWLQGVNTLPNRYEPIRSSWLEHHPTWYYRVWDEKTLIPLIKQYYTTLLPLYKKLKYAIQRVHFLKYIIMYHYGGVIVDMDIYCNQNIESMLRDSPQDPRLVFVTRYNQKGKTQLPVHFLSGKRLKDGPYLSTAFLASTERNPFWLEVIREILVQNSIYPKSFDEFFETYIHRTTGSTLLTCVYNGYKPTRSKILENKIIDPAKGLCLTKLITMMDFKPSKVFIFFTS